MCDTIAHLFCMAPFLSSAGKTVLAIDAVSNANLLRDMFPGGVFWLSVGKMSSSNGEMNSAALLEKVQNFIARMDEKRNRPLNLESATDYLQEVMMEQYPQSLLILDDLWEVETADVFAVRCRTLVTTRNADVTNGINTPDVYSVSVREVSVRVVVYRMGVSAYMYATLHLYKLMKSNL